MTAILLAVAALLAAAPALAATPFDGLYKGGNSSAGGGARCPAGTSFNILVRDGSFDWKLGNEVAPVRINPDGTFKGQSGARFINGSFADGKMTAMTTGTNCNYSWSLSR